MSLNFIWCRDTTYYFRKISLVHPRLLVGVKDMGETLFKVFDKITDIYSFSYIHFLFTSDSITFLMFHKYIPYIYVLCTVYFSYFKTNILYEYLILLLDTPSDHTMWCDWVP